LGETQKKSLKLQISLDSAASKKKKKIFPLHENSESPYETIERGNIQQYMYIYTFGWEISKDAI
jgi:hypothetical protein